MTKRLFYTMFLLAASVLILFSVLSVGVLYPHFESSHNEEIITKARYIAAGVENKGMAYLSSLPPMEERITWINAQGGVLYDSAAPADTMSNHSDREEFQEAVAGGTGDAVRHSDTMQETRFNYAIRLKDNTVLRVSGVYYSITMLVVTVARPMALVLVITLIVSVLLAYRFSKIVVRPIHELDPEHPERHESYEELKPLLKKISKQNRTIRNQMVDLFRQQQEFDTIAANMTEGMLVVDENANLLSYNSAASRLLNITSDATGENVYRLNQREDFREVVEEALSGRHSQQLMPLADRTYQLIGNPVKDNNNPVGAVLAILDVTEREERDRLRQEFSANVSHELKTPLTSISGFAEIMMTGVAKPEDMRRFAGNIYDEAQRLISLIGDIIQLSRLDEKDLSSQIQPVDLYALAQSVVNRLKTDGDKRNVQLTLQGNTCILQGVPHVLEEMISNLCDNAIKYNKEGGSVTVAVLPREEDILLAVTDTGIGIPYDEQERVFERFYRVDKSHSKQIGGTGLGLSIVKHAVLFHNGKLNLESTPREGTCITVSFPKPTT